MTGFRHATGKPRREEFFSACTAFLFLFITFAPVTKKNTDRIMAKMRHAVFMLLAFLLSSCMGENGDIYTYGSQAGVVRLTPDKVISLRSGKQITSSEFQDQPVEDGDCCLVDYKVNYSSSENKDAALYKVDILNFLPVKSWPLNGTPDTAAHRRDESYLTVSIKRGVYVDGYFFLYPEYKRYYHTQTDSFSISYDPHAEPVFDEATRRSCLLLYLRSTSSYDANDSVFTTSKAIPQAFHIQEFVDNAVKKGYVSGDSLNFRMAYPEYFSEENGTYSWKYSDIYTILMGKYPDDL